VATPRSEVIQKTTSPKRPKTLRADVHHIKIRKQLDKPRVFDYLVVVGLYGDDPYEIFVMENGSLDKKYTGGIITKVKRGVYKLEIDNGPTIEDVTVDTTESEDIFTRMASAALRHGTDISYLVDQLEKSEGDLWSFGKAMSRALKKYLKNGTKISGANCPSCGNEDLIRNEGCATCVRCGFSKCS